MSMGYLQRDLRIVKGYCIDGFIPIRKVKVDYMMGVEGGGHF
jgi:hypothetical protein